MAKDKAVSPIQSMASVAPIEFITSGVAEIDAMTGGYPRARVTHIAGLAGVGKTSLMVKCLAAISQQSRVLFLDVENAVNIQRVKELGGDVTKVDYSNLFVLEDVCELIRQNIGNYDAIILDSIAMLVPRAEHDGSVGDAHVGLKPRLLGQWLRMIEGDLGQSKTALILINQMRRTMELYGDKYVWPGGMQLKYSASLMLKLSTTKADKFKTEKGEGHWIHVKVEKTKVSQPNQETKFKLMY